MRAIGWPGAKVVQKTVSRLAGKKLAHLQPERMGARVLKESNLGVYCSR